MSAPAWWRLVVAAVRATPRRAPRPAHVGDVACDHHSHAVVNPQTGRCNLCGSTFEEIVR